MPGIRYVTGDATRPEGEGPKIIVHICNDIGAWGRGFVLALSKRFKEAGGDWGVIAPVTEEALCRHGLNVTVYDLPIS